MKPLHFGQKRSMHEVGDNEDTVAEEIHVIKKKISTFHQNHKKDALRTSQKLAS